MDDGADGSCFVNAAPEAFRSCLKWEVSTRHEYPTTRQTQTVVPD